MNWQKVILFVAIVLTPALLVGISNQKVFPDVISMASLMLGITVVVAGVFTWLSKDAMPKVRRYCLLVDLAICVALCINMGGHWLLARELSAAKQSQADRREGEDREEKRRAAEVERQLLLKRADVELEQTRTRQIAAEARRLGRLPIEERRSVLTPREIQTPAPLPSVPVAVEWYDTKTPARVKTPEEVMQSWVWFLTVMAFAECFLSVGGGGVLMTVWEWDRNHDGIPDHTQTQAMAIQPTRPLNAPERRPPSGAIWPHEFPEESNGAPSGKMRPAWWKLWRK